MFIYQNPNWFFAYRLNLFLYSVEYLLHIRLHTLPRNRRIKIIYTLFSFVVSSLIVMRTFAENSKPKNIPKNQSKINEQNQNENLITFFLSSS